MVDYLNGVGMGLVFKAKAAAGGLDIIAAVIKVKFDIAMKNTFLMVNFFVICAGVFYLDLSLSYVYFNINVYNFYNYGNF